MTLCDLDTFRTKLFNCIKAFFVFFKINRRKNRKLKILFNSLNTLIAPQVSGIFLATLGLDHATSQLGLKSPRIDKKTKFRFPDSELKIKIQ